MSSREIKVSIVVPVYNSAEFLDQCIESLVNQTLKEIEIILVNDASPDCSQVIIDKWKQKDDRIVSVVNPQNMLCGYTLNRGIKCARGKYIGFLAGDDFDDSNLYKTLIDNSDDLTADIVMDDSFYMYYDENRKNIITYLDKGMSLQDIKRKMAAHGGSNVAPWIVRRDFLINNNLFFAEGIFFEDNPIVPIWILLANKINIVHQAHYYYRQNPDSQLHKKDNPRVFDRLTSAKLYLENVHKYNVYNEWKEEIDYTFFRIFIFNTLLNVANTFKNLPIARLRDAIKEYLTIAGKEIKSNKYYVARKLTLDEKILDYICFHPNSVWLLYFYRFYIWSVRLAYKLIKG